MKPIIKDVHTKKEIMELYEESALTFEGLLVEDGKDIVEWLDSHGALTEDSPEIYRISANE